MARPAKFDEEQILDAALHLVTEGGPGAATIGAIAERMKAPSGSIYHRFQSRDLLLARLWIRTIKRFQRGFLEALAADDLDEAAIGAALHNVRWLREHLAEARVLLLYRREDLAARWPDALGDELAVLNATVETALRDHARRRFGESGGAADREALRRVVFALVDVPYAAGRRHVLAAEPPPPSLDDLVTETCRSVLRRAAYPAVAHAPTP